MTNTLDKKYIELLKEIMYKGHDYKDRTGVGRRSIIGHEMKIDLQEGFPLLTTKKVAFNLVKTELFWFLGIHKLMRPYFKFNLTNIKFLVDNNNYIWVDWPYQKYLEIMEEYKDKKIFMEKYGIDRYNTLEYLPLSRKEFIERIKKNDEFAELFGNLGPVYGKQWVNYGATIEKPVGINQIDKVINNIVYDPYSSRHVVSAWNPTDNDKMLLPPCHYSFQFFVEPSDKEQDYLSCKFTMRSTDVFLGLPFNIASYALLTHMVAQITNKIPKTLIYSGGDVHLYHNHFKQASQQIANYNKQIFDLPSLSLNKKMDIFNYRLEDVKINDYESHPFISAPIAV